MTAHAVRASGAALALLALPFPLCAQGQSPTDPGAAASQESHAHRHDDESQDEPVGAAAAQPRTFNPDILVFADFLGSFSDDADNQRANRFSLREVQLEFGAELADFADALVILTMVETLEDDENGKLQSGYEFELEEGYLGLHDERHRKSLKLGKFRAAFGQNNRLHTHDLPQVSRPLAVQSFLGAEGLAATGLSGRLLPLPLPARKLDLELRLEVVNADGGPESPLLGGPEADGPALVSRVGIASDASILGASYLYGPTSVGENSVAHMLGVDAQWTFFPSEHSDRHGTRLAGEAFWARNDLDPTAGVATNESFGAYLFGEAQLHQDWFLGLRGDYTEFPNDPVRGPWDKDWAVSPYLTWYAHDWIRLRLEYQHLERRVAGNWSSEELVALQVTFAFGAQHRH